jgi:hypothetical protein
MTDDIVARLRVLLSKCCIAPAMGVWSRDLRDAADEIERLRAERDEARREVCEWVALQTKRTSREVEQGRGWDCFDGDGWSDPGDECQREAL